MLELKRKNYCRYKCLPNGNHLPNPNLTAVFKNSAINQIKIQKGGTPQFRKLSHHTNQFGRILGTGGKSLSNFN